MIVLLWWLLIGHALADFVLQSDTMARAKNRNNPPMVPPPGQKYFPTWPYWLTAHALIHGGIVMLITGNPTLGFCEAVAHWLIDFGKCENLYGVNEDQAMHAICKLLWAVAAMGYLR